MTLKRPEPILAASSHKALVRAAELVVTTFLLQPEPASARLEQESRLVWADRVVAAAMAEKLLQLQMDSFIRSEINRMSLLRNPSVAVAAQVDTTSQLRQAAAGLPVELSA